MISIAVTGIIQVKKLHQ